jgi:uncharacterized protein
MSRGTAERAIDFGLAQAAAQGGPDAAPHLTLGFFGGEPLMAFDLLQWAHRTAADRARERRVALDFTLTTNLTLLDAHTADWLLARDYALGLSLDGNAAMHDTFRVYPDGRGSHADCLRGLDRIAGRGARAEIICVVHPATLPHLADSVEWLAARFGFKIALNPDFSADWTEAALEDMRRQYLRIGDFYLARFLGGRPLSVNVIDGKIRTHLQGGYRACDRCSMGEREVAVAVSGNLYPCARLVGDDDKADVRIGTVAQGYDSAALLRLLARRGNRNPACGACPLKPRCMNWCGCVNYVTSGGDIGRVGAFTCWHEKLVIEIADRIAGALWDARNPAFLAKFYGGQ